MQYSPEWDLSSIPDSVFASERAKRVAAKRKTFGRPKIAPCESCGRLINARQRRFPCPFHLPPSESATLTRVKKSRDEVMLAVALAIAEVENHGPGKWHLQKTGRRDVTLSYQVQAKALQDSATPESNRDGAEAYSETIWKDFGGDEILIRAGIPGDYEAGTIDWVDDGELSFFAVIPCGG
jgi:hypothetical protein